MTSEHKALALYIMAARSIYDFLEGVNETDEATLTLLHKILTHPPGPNTDAALNKMLAPIVARRLNK